MITPTKTFRLGLCLLLPLTVLLTACAGRAKVSSEWLDNKQSAAPYSRVVVVGVSKNSTRRLSFEEALVRNLDTDAVQIWAASRNIAPDQEPDELTVQAIAEEKNADGIVVTRVTHMEMTPVEIGGRSTVLAEEHQTGQSHTFRRQQGTLFRYDYDEDVEATHITAEFTTELHTDVYDTASGKLVYTINSSVSQQENLSNVIKILSDKIANRLRRDRVVAK